jgi:ABC-type sugar transport system ATPase subunit
VTSEFARDGGGVLMISSDLPEILGMSDRVLVMRRGRLRGEFTREQATSEVLLRAASDA